MKCFRLIELIFASQVQALRTLRTVRVLRPLKSINSMPSKDSQIMVTNLGIRKHVYSLVASIPNFARVGAFLLFVFLMLSVFGLHFYGSSFYNRCRFNQVPETPTSWAIDTTLT